MLGADGLDAARALRAQLADEAQQRWASAAETAIVTLQRALAAEKVRGRAELDALRAESMRGGEEAGGRAGGRRYEGDIDW